METERRDLVVFISHVSEDRRLVRELAEELGRAGVRVWYDESAAAPKQVREWIEQGFSEARYKLVVFIGHGAPATEEGRGPAERFLLQGRTVTRETVAVLHKATVSETVELVPELRGIEAAEGDECVLARILEGREPEACWRTELERYFYWTEARKHELGDNEDLSGNVISRLVAAALRSRGDFPPEGNESALEEWLEGNKEDFVAEARREREEESRRRAGEEELNEDRKEVSGEEKELAALVKEFMPRLLHYARHYTRGAYDAADMVQSALLRLWENRKEFDLGDRRRIFAYMATNVRHELYRQRRRAAAAPRIEAAALADEGVPREPDEVQAVRAALEKLPNDERLLVMRFVEGRTVAEVDRARRKSLPKEPEPEASIAHLFVYPISPFKRAMDIFGSLIAIILFSPTMLAVALAVKLSSRGPVIFKQKRAGLGGRPFDFYKFRTMVVNAEELKIDLSRLNEQTGPVFKIRRDPRITRVGRILRMTSIDTLPALFNVLKGDISLIGPRPPLLNEVACYTERQRSQPMVTPGLICIWQ